ncbi:MAG: hypothetical protein FJW88_03795 [Actinobacteria bacterium]|nr:hypothetical protein [Actinomycetota bacterium]
MAKPSKYSRARIRSRVRRPKRAGASRIWSFVIAGVVVVGVAGVVLTKMGSDTAEASPKIGDHWHAYLGVDVCGTWLGNAPEFSYRAGQGGVRAGLHSHGDGLMHMHPHASDEAGENATVGRYLEFNGWGVSSDALQVWDGTEHTTGQSCGEGVDAKEAEVQWVVGEPGKPWPTKARTGDPADYRPQNGEIVAIYFLPKGEKLEKPPLADQALGSIEDIGGRSATNDTTASTTGEGTVTTTAATETITSISTP